MAARTGEAARRCFHSFFRHRAHGRGVSFGRSTKLCDVATVFRRASAGMGSIIDQLWRRSFRLPPQDCAAAAGVKSSLDQESFRSLLCDSGFLVCVRYALRCLRFRMLSVATLAMVPHAFNDETTGGDATNSDVRM